MRTMSLFLLGGFRFPRRMPEQTKRRQITHVAPAASYSLHNAPPCARFGGRARSGGCARSGGRARARAGFFRDAALAWAHVLWSELRISCLSRVIRAWRLRVAGLRGSGLRFRVMRDAARLRVLLRPTPISF